VSSGSRSRNEGGIGEEERLLTIVDAARFLNVAPSSLYHMIARPGSRIPVIRLSARCVRFSRRALVEWVEALSQSAERRNL
jgi:predicted DNA-binding transcriptional regulator AlpA